MAEPSLTLVRRFRASPEDLFDACTDPAKLRLWFGPAAFVVTHLEADPRPGGRLVLRMDGPDGAVAAEATFREVAPPRGGRGRVVLDWTWTQGPPGAAPLHVPSVVTFEVAPDGTGGGAGSRLTLTHAGFRDGPGKTHEEGWAEAAAKLATLLNAEDTP